MTREDGDKALRLSVELFLVRLLPFLEDQVDSRDGVGGRVVGNEAMQLHAQGTALLGSLESMRVVEGAQPEPRLDHPFVKCSAEGGHCYAFPSKDCHQILDWGTESQRVCLLPEAAHIPRAAEPERGETWHRYAPCDVGGGCGNPDCHDTGTSRLRLIPCRQPEDSPVHRVPAPSAPEPVEEEAQR